MFCCWAWVYRAWSETHFALFVEAPYCCLEICRQVRIWPASVCLCETNDISDIRLEAWHLVPVVFLGRSIVCQPVDILKKQACCTGLPFLNNCIAIVLVDIGVDWFGSLSGGEDGRDKRAEAERGGTEGSIGSFQYRCLEVVGCMTDWFGGDIMNVPPNPKSVMPHRPRWWFWTGCVLSLHMG
jgi:hypothetical protein